MKITKHSPLAFANDVRALYDGIKLTRIKGSALKPKDDNELVVMALRIIVVEQGVKDVYSSGALCKELKQNLKNNIGYMNLCYTGNVRLLSCQCCHSLCRPVD